MATTGLQWCVNVGVHYTLYVRVENLNEYSLASDVVQS